MIKIPNLKTQYYEDTYISTTEDFDFPIHLFSTDQFRMFQFKVKKCQRGRSHDWTECPYSHPGEKARRRDPQKYNYSGYPCPEFRKLGNCARADSCQFSHGVFECWLHPSRYRTQLCNDGTNCRRRVCFFAHTIDQLRNASSETFVSSPTSVLDSSPGKSPYSVVPVSVRKVVDFIRNVRVDESGRVPDKGCGIGSLQVGFFNLPPLTSEGVVMERVESGFSKGYSNDGPVPDIGWVSELVN